MIAVLSVRSKQNNPPSSVVPKLLLFRVSTLMGAYQQESGNVYNFSLCLHQSFGSFSFLLYIYAKVTGSAY